MRKVVFIIGFIILALGVLPHLGFVSFALAPTFPDRKVGVNVGDHIAYTVTYSFGLEWMSYTIDIYINSISGTIIYYTQICDYPRPSTSTIISDVSSTEIAKLGGGMFIGANLTIGDLILYQYAIFLTDGTQIYYDFYITSSKQKTYWNQLRTVNIAEYISGEYSISYYFDKVTGICVEAYLTVTYGGISGYLQLLNTKYESNVSLPIPYWITVSANTTTIFINVYVGGFYYDYLYGGNTVILGLYGEQTISVDSQIPDSYNKDYQYVCINNNQKVTPLSNGTHITFYFSYTKITPILQKPTPIITLVTPTHKEGEYSYFPNEEISFSADKSVSANGNIVSPHLIFSGVVLMSIGYFTGKKKESI